MCQLTYLRPMTNITPNDEWLYKMGFIITLRNKGLTSDDIEFYRAMKPWYAPAGLKRGTISVITVGKKVGRSIFNV